jgi:hypothetical protein
MKKLIALMGLMAVALIVGRVYADGKATTQKYEVVCMKCVAKHTALGDKGGHGDSHAACAMKCSAGGTDLGLMDAKGNVYVPVDGDFKPARGKLADKAGQTIELTGTLMKTKGINYLMIQDSKDSSTPAKAKD